MTTLKTLRQAAAGKIPALDLKAIKAGKVPLSHLAELKAKLTLMKGILI